ncbi:MAG: Unknown protein [uncultured Campylobacterales bacterium]|uniref:Glutaredoxin domain-containing protein n=1 Tax=uncultured Campylobacterales bacterium TaxID=352960 RepID=A0A6S6TBW0_9BACT|nr:MAG: Unknown protein [uncultured Campylobacterales bacterium]
MKKNNKNKIGYVYLPMILILYIVGNYILTSTGNAVCESSGCKIAEDTINIDSLYLNCMGALFGVILILVSWQKKLSNFILYAGILFESLMIGYQFFVSGSMCYYCLGVYGILLLTAVARFKFIVPITTIATVVVFYMMVKFVMLDGVITKTSNTVFLFGSPTCEHCIEVKEYLNRNNVAFEFKDVLDMNNQYIMKFFKISSIPVVVVKNIDNIDILLTKEKVKEYYKDKSKPSFNLDDMLKGSSVIPATGGCKVDLPCSE